MKPIEWIEQDKYFGLDYSTKKGKWWNYTFDIRYDYDGNPEVKPNCGLVLTIYYKDKVIGNANAKHINILVGTSEAYVKLESEQILKLINE